MGVKTTIALYKTYEQLLVEKYKPGDVYTCDVNSKLQIREIFKEHDIYCVNYILLIDNIASMYRYTVYLKDFVCLLNKNPISVFIRNEEIWEKT